MKTLVQQSLATLILIVFSGYLAISQIDFQQFEDLKFRNIGPAGMSGRVTTIDVDLSDDKIIYVGTASGGVWKSINGGVSWKPIFDDQPTLSIGSIKINQNNPDEIWVGTGEGNPRNSVNTGGGIFKSLDGGNSWELMGLEKTKVIHRIIIHADDGKTVYAAAMGSPWGPHPERGVYRTTDGGLTWENILSTNLHSGVGDMVVDPSNPNRILAAMYEHKRTPWDFKSGGEGSGLYLTIDGGDNWTQITDQEGIPEGTIGRIGLAFAPSKPDIVYALIESKVNGLYKSTDGGNNWFLVSKNDIGDRPFYYSEIYVDPQNENRIYNLFTYLSRSEDGGKSFENIADYGNSVHPDHHAFWIHPENPDFLIDGNDGGLNISRDGGETWKFINNIPVGQFYHVNIDHGFPYNVYGGMQDNGTWMGPSKTFKRGGISNYDFQELLFGDGFDVMPYPGDSRYGYAMSQGGNVSYYDRKTGATSIIKPNHPEGLPLRYNWNAPMAQDPFVDCGVYFGSQYVHYSEDCGKSWTIISPDLTTNDTTKQKQDKSGGLTIDATNAENHTTLIAIAPSPVDKKVIWAASDDGRLHVTMDGGEQWHDVYNGLKGAPKGAWIPQIEVSSSNPGEAFVVLNNYRKNDYRAFAYHTTNYGESWTRIIDDSDVPSFILSIVQDKTSPNLLFLGSDVGLYVSFDKGNHWQVMDEGFPHVQVSDLKIHPKGDLVIGTFGRALWILDDISPLREIADKGEEILEDEMRLFPIRDAYKMSNRSYEGIRFYAQGEFSGDNLRNGMAAIPIWLKANKKDKPKEIKVLILNENQDTIRNFTSKVKPGYHKIYWRLDANGERFPSRSQPRKDANPRGGFPILTGKYEVQLTLDSLNTSTQYVNVKNDPRMNVNYEDQVHLIEEATDLNNYIRLARNGWENLRKMRASLDNIKSLSSLQTQENQDSIKNWSKPVYKEIEDLELIFMQPKGLKGIQRNPNNLNGKLSTAFYYLRSGWEGVSDNDKMAINAAKTLTLETNDKINHFIDRVWRPYEDKVRALKLEMMESIEKNTME